MSNELANIATQIQVVPSREEREDMIAVAAYFLAERRGFSPGQELEDWLAAASTVDQMLEGMKKAGVTHRQFERVGLRNALRMWVDEPGDAPVESAVPAG